MQSITRCQPSQWSEYCHQHAPKILVNEQLRRNCSKKGWFIRHQKVTIFSEIPAAWLMNGTTSLANYIVISAKRKVSNCTWDINGLYNTCPVLFYNFIRSYDQNGHRYEMSTWGHARWQNVVISNVRALISEIWFWIRCIQLYRIQMDMTM